MESDAYGPGVPLDVITGNIVDASLKIHRDLGPGLLESVYEELLARELERRGFELSGRSGFDSSMTGLYLKGICAWTFLSSIE